MARPSPRLACRDQIYAEPVAPVVVAVLVLVIAVPVVLWCLKTVGEIAEEHGEDKVRWQVMMLPLGIFGPIVARAMLDRNGRGGGGGFA
jgi:hypothetical protein